MKTISRPLTIVAIIFSSLIFMAPKAESALVDDSYWEVRGEAISSGTNYEGSKLVFETQISQSTYFNITGYFDWYIGPDYYGRELFSGTLTGYELHFEGHTIIDPVGPTPPLGNLGLAIYDAELTLDETNIINGVWRNMVDGPTGEVKGIWSASQVPVPGTVWLLFSGMVGLIGIKKKFKV